MAGRRVKVLLCQKLKKKADISVKPPTYSSDLHTDTLPSLSIQPQIVTLGQSITIPVLGSRTTVRCLSPLQSRGTAEIIGYFSISIEYFPFVLCWCCASGERPKIVHTFSIKFSETL